MARLKEPSVIMVPGEVILQSKAYSLTISFSFDCLIIFTDVVMMIFANIKKLFFSASRSFSFSLDNSGIFCHEYHLSVPLVLKSFCAFP